MYLTTLFIISLFQGLLNLMSYFNKETCILLSSPCLILLIDLSSQKMCIILCTLKDRFLPSFMFLFTLNKNSDNYWSSLDHCIQYYHIKKCLQVFGFVTFCYLICFKVPSNNYLKLGQKHVWDALRDMLFNCVLASRDERKSHRIYM